MSVLATTLYAGLAALSCLHLDAVGHPESWLALLAVPVAILARERPYVVALAFALGGAFLRVEFALTPVTSDQIIVSQAALSAVLRGENPYGHGYQETTPPGSPYPYGPLALLWSPLGVWGEVITGTATMLLMVRARTLLTLSVYATYWVVVDLSTSGLNDVTPGFLITAGLLALPTRPRLGAAILAVGAAFKPYAFAWVPAAIGYGGVGALVGAVLTTAVLWSPLLVWGPLSFLRSIELAAATHPEPNALDRPELRILALPVAVASLLVRCWWLVVASGAAIFFIVLFFDRWASLGYVLAVGPIVAITAEIALRERLGGRAGNRGARRGSPVPV